MLSSKKRTFTITLRYSRNTALMIMKLELNLMIEILRSGDLDLDFDKYYHWMAEIVVLSTVDLRTCFFNDQFWTVLRFRHTNT